MSSPSNDELQHLHTVSEASKGQLWQQTWEDKGRHHGTAGAIHMDAHVPAILLVDLACMHAALHHRAVRDGCATLSRIPRCFSMLTHAVCEVARSSQRTNNLVRQHHVFKLAIIC